MNSSTPDPYAVMGDIPSRTDKVKQHLQTLLRTQLGWGLLVFVVVFVWLYLVNPPMVQKAKDPQQPFQVPSPDFNYILLISFLSAMVVILGPKIQSYV